MVRFASGRRVKVVTKAYVKALQRCKEVHPLHIWTLVRLNNLGSFLQTLPKHVREEGLVSASLSVHVRS